jgi:uncharacterized membrane protein
VSGPADELSGADGDAPRRARLLASAGSALWVVAVCQLLDRSHNVLSYDVTPDSIGLLQLAVAIGAGVALAAFLWQRAALAPAHVSRSGLLLLGCAVVPLLGLCRTVAPAMPLLFGEGLVCAVLAGAAASTAAKGSAGPAAAVTRHCTLAAALAAAGLAGYCFLDGCRAYDDFLLGYPDFGQFARRVANTWAGRGLLNQGDGSTIFWDHFNPGLLLLAPLWGLWADARLFIALQALCLAAPGFAVYAIARRLGADPGAALRWALSYLLFPAVSQLNLSHSYGWHPVSMALPCLFAALWALAARRPWWALAAAVLACSFKENVFIVVVGFALGQALSAIRRAAVEVEAAAAPAAAPGVSAQVRAGLSMRAWLGVAAGFAVAFLLVYHFAGFAGYQGNRFGALGDSTGAILLSPLLRPGAFWGEVLAPRSIYFVLLLALPLGVLPLIRGWPALAAGVLPLGVLLAWDQPGATSIGFQYVTLLLPVLFLALLLGGTRTAVDCRRWSWYCLAATATLSFTVGAMPWSGDSGGVRVAHAYRADWEQRAQVLRRAVAYVHERGGADASVLATVRLAAHFLDLQRSEPFVGHHRRNLQQQAEAAGITGGWIELFDWVVVDVQDTQFQHNLAEIGDIVALAEAADYDLVSAEWGVLVYRRPGSAPVADADPDLLGSMRLSRPSQPPTQVAETLAVSLAAWSAQPQGAAAAEPTTAERLTIALDWQCLKPSPNGCLFVLQTFSADGQLLSDWGGMQAPLDGNRPVYWWQPGDCYRQLLKGGADWTGKPLVHRLTILPLDDMGRPRQQVARATVFR